MAQTDGEWELINVKVVSTHLEIADGKYSQIKYYVCFLSFENLVFSNHSENIILNKSLYHSYTFKDVQNDKPRFSLYFLSE